MKKMIPLLLAAVSLTACERIEPGHVGVKVNRYGSGAGVQKTPVGVGTYQTMFGVDIYEYPIYTIPAVWKRGAEGEPNEELTFQDKNGLVVSADVNVAYRVNPALAPKLFQTYRVGMDGIVASPLRNKVRSALVNAASTMTVEEIYGPKKAVLINRALADVRRYFEPQGLHVDQLDWAGPIRIPAAITERINARAQTEQAAIAARARVATEQANGEAEVAKAKAEADAAIARATGQAEAIKIKNAAVATNPGYQNEYLRKWDGRLPQTVYCTSEKPCVVAGQ